MKMFLSLSVFIMLLTSGVKSNAQNLTMDEVISIRTKSIAYVEEYLTSRNWEMTAVKEEDSLGYSSLDFAYQKQTDGSSAVAFIHFYKYERGVSSLNHITLQVHSLKIYNSYLSRIKLLGLKLSSSKFIENGVEKLYKGKFDWIWVYNNEVV